MTAAQKKEIARLFKAAQKAQTELNDAVREVVQPLLDKKGVTVGEIRDLRVELHEVAPANFHVLRLNARLESMPKDASTLKKSGTKKKTTKQSTTGE